MNLEVTELENGITKVTLSGRLDVEGALKIDSQFNDIAKEKKKVVVDLSEVAFMASLGLRTLITGAKATGNNGGKMVLMKSTAKRRKGLEDKPRGYRNPDHS